MPVMSFEWKLVAEPVMQLYTESTDGSYIEYKESALVWHHRFADPDFGSWQAKEMQNHLESVLANEPVTVKSGAQIVEVTPQVWMMMPCVLRRCLDKCMIGCGCVNSHQP
jgi:trehalose 6-phosphate synthase/phosphatase